MEEELRIGVENSIRELISEPLTIRVKEEDIFNKYLTSVTRSEIREILNTLKTEGKIEREVDEGKEVYWVKVFG